MSETPQKVKSEENEEKPTTEEREEEEGAPAEKRAKTDQNACEEEMITKCTFCGELGHSRRKCPHRNKGARNEDPVDNHAQNVQKSLKQIKALRRYRDYEIGCFMCGEIGHSGRVCFKFYGTKNDTTTEEDTTIKEDIAAEEDTTIKEDITTEEDTTVKEDITIKEDTDDKNDTNDDDDGEDSDKE